MLGIGASSVEEASEEISLPELRAAGRPLAAAATVSKRLLDSLWEELLILGDNSVLGYIESNIPKKEGGYKQNSRQRNRVTTKRHR